MKRSWIFFMLAILSLSSYTQQNSIVSVSIPKIGAGDLIYINDTLYVVLDVEQAKKGRIIYNRYHGMIEAEQVLLARLDEKDGEILALRRANEKLTEATKVSEAIIANREEVIMIKDRDIRKLKLQRLIIGGIAVLFIII